MGLNIEDDIGLFKQDQPLTLAKLNIVDDIGISPPKLQIIDDLGLVPSVQENLIQPAPSRLSVAARQVGSEIKQTANLALNFTVAVGHTFTDLKFYQSISEIGGSIVDFAGRAVFDVLGPDFKTKFKPVAEAVERATLSPKTLVAWSQVQNIDLDTPALTTIAGGIMLTYGAKEGINALRVSAKLLARKPGFERAAANVNKIIGRLKVSTTNVNKMSDSQLLKFYSDLPKNVRADVARKNPRLFDLLREMNRAGATHPEVIRGTVASSPTGRPFIRPPSAQPLAVAGPQPPQAVAPATAIPAITQPTAQPLAPPAQPVTRKVKIPSADAIVKEVEQINKRIPASKVNRLVRQKAGVSPVNQKVYTEPQALRISMKRQERIANQVTKHANQVNKLIHQIQVDVPNNIAFQAANEIRTLQKTLRGDTKLGIKPIRTLEGLKDLYKQIARIRTTGMTQYRETVTLKKEVFNFSRGLLTTTLRGGEAPPTGGIKGTAATAPKRPGLLKTASAINMRPWVMFDKMDHGQNFSGPNSRYFLHRASSAVNSELKAFDVRKQNINELLNRQGLTDKYLASSREVDGHSFTVDEMLTVYMDAQNKENTLALVYGNGIPVHTMQNIIAQMTPQEKIGAEGIMADYEENYGRVRDQLIEITDGKVDMARVAGKYSPILRKQVGYAPTENELTEEMMGRARLRQIFVEKKFTKGRVEVPKDLQVQKRLGAVAIWRDQAAKQEHFIAFGNLVRDMRSMIQSKEFREAVEGSIGKQFLPVIDRWVDKIANPNIYKAVAEKDKIVATLRRNAAISFLAPSIAVRAKQLPSIALFLSDMPTTDFLGGIYDYTTNHTESIALIHELSPQMKHRSINRTLEELKNLDSKGYEKILKMYGQKAMFGIAEIDGFVTHAGWLGKFSQGKGQGLSDQEAADQALAMVLRSQPAAHPKDLPDIYTTNEMWNAILQFTNQLNQIYYQVTYDIPQKISSGNYLDAIRAAYGVGIGAIVMTTINNRKKIQAGLFEISDVPGALLETALMPLPLGLGRAAVSTLKGFDFVNIPAAAGIKAGVLAISNAAAGRAGKAVFNGINATAILLGIPFPRATLRDFLIQDTKTKGKR